MHKNTLYRALLNTSAIVALGLAPAYAQDNSDQNQDDQANAAQSSDDEVIVTGSRIKRDNFSSPVSMDVLNTEDAKIEGIADLGGLLTNRHGCFRFINKSLMPFQSPMLPMAVSVLRPSGFAAWVPAGPLT